MTRGRPPLDPTSPTTQLTLRLSVKQLDDLCREASQARLSVPELMRRKMRARRSGEKDSENRHR